MVLAHVRCLSRPTGGRQNRNSTQTVQNSVLHFVRHWVWWVRSWGTGPLISLEQAACFRSFHPLTGECNGTCPHLCTQFTPQHADDLCHRRHHRRHRRRPLFTDVNELAGFPQGASLHNPLSGTAAWACSIRLISVSRIGRSDAGRRGLCGWVSSVAMSPRR